MTLKFSTTLRTARAQKIIDAIDADTNPGTLDFYTGPQPASGDPITTETLLGTLTLNKPCGTVAAGVLTFDTITEDPEADASGDAIWARCSDGAGTFVMDLSVAKESAPGEPPAAILMNTNALVAGGPIRVTSGVITEGNA